MTAPTEAKAPCPLAVMDEARVCIAAYPTHDPMVHDRPQWDPVAALARHDEARAKVAELVAAVRWLQRLRAIGDSIGDCPQESEASDAVDAALAAFSEVR